MTTGQPNTWVGHEPRDSGELASLRVVMAGRLARKSDRIDTIFEHWAVGMVVAGRGSFQVEGGAVEELCAPCVFHIAPGIRYAYGPAAGETWEERFVAVEGARVREWVSIGWLRQAARPVALPAREAGWLAELHESAGRALHGPGGRLSLAKLLFEQWIWQLHDVGRAAAVDHPVDALARTWREQPPVGADLAAVARELGLSYSHFRALFRERIGVSPARYLLSLRVGLACRLLSAGLPVKQVARETGFPHLSGFYRAFSRATGKVPGRYQDEARRWLGEHGR